ncbi:hypothetical protein EDB83DRAFT_2533012 [Lactarius deliciosus]|nr:hypothetical protein EDB83DRAFT_2533012 [Lactarius deliciosus]
MREQDTCMWDKPPPLQLPLLFARKGGEAQELSAAWDRTHDGPCVQRQGQHDGPLPGFHAEATCKRGARENRHTPHTLCAPLPFAHGQHVNGSACSNLEQRANQNMQKRPPSLGACSASAWHPSLPRFTHQGKMRMVGGVDPRSPTASPQGRTRMGGHAEATLPFPQVRAPGQNATRKPPPPLYALWGHAGRA